MPDRLFLMLSRIQHRLTVYMKKELKKEGVVLSPGQVGILLVLEQDGQTTMGKLSRTLDIDNAAITRLVDKLEKRALVERRVNPEDRRQIMITITNRGQDQAGAVIKVVRAANRKIRDGFSEAEMAVYKRVSLAILEKFL